MNYTISLDLWIDQEEIITSDEVEDFLKNVIRVAGGIADISNVQILDIND